MGGRRGFLAFTLLCMTAPAARAAGADGLLAEWNFDGGKGDVARDASGNGRDAKIFGATRVKQGGGLAVSLDGVDDYVAFVPGSPLELTGPVSVEAWIKPTRKAKGLAVLLGQDLHSYLLGFNATDHINWYIGAGGNSISAKVKLHKWNHVAATFDGERMTLWVNGRQAAGRKSKFTSYPKRDHFIMATKGRPDLPHFKGALDNVRVYSRALSKADVVAHITKEARTYGIKVRARGGAPSAASTQFFKTHAGVIAAEETKDAILFANRRVGLEFLRSKGGFELNRLYGVAEDQDFLTGGRLVGARDLFEVVMTLDPKHVGRDDRLKEKGGLFGIMAEMAGDAFTIGSQGAKSVSWRREGDDAESTLHLEWKRINVRENKAALDVHVTVTLRAGDPLSYWRINVTNRSKRYGIERVRFPILPLAPIGDAKDNAFIHPTGRGCLVEDPFGQATGFGRHYNTRGAFYPHNFNMQFQALYNKESGTGIYVATRDSTPHLMNIQIANTPSEITWRPGHFPPNITFSEEDYALPYDCVAGPFRGDWFDACTIYREWAVKQSWCRKGPLSKRGDVPKWYKEAPLIFYTALSDSAEGTHSADENLTIAAEHFREILKWAGVKLPLNLYTWHDYDPTLTVSNVPFNSRRMINAPGRWTNLPSTYEPYGNYPKAPAMLKLSAECKRLRELGGMVCPYLGLEIFDQGPTENAPYAAEAKPNITRDLYGALRTWAGLRQWQPCSQTPWWRERLKETCVLMLQRENVGGFYLDVMQGCALPCYWTPHGHSAAGGDSMTTGMHGLCETIYDAIKAQDPEAITTGENTAENMIDVTDGILGNTLAPENTVPIFAAVYQDYIPRYGLEMSAGLNDAFFMESASLFLEGAQVGRFRLRPRSSSLSLHKPEQKELFDFLALLVGYYKQDAAKKFLTYGRLMRPVEFCEPAPMPMLSFHHSSYVYNNGVIELPALMTGVFRSEDGELGVFMVNASGEELAFQAEVDLVRHGLPKDVVVDVDRLEADGTSRKVLGKAKGVVSLKGSLPGHQVTMFRLKPTARP